MLAGRLTDLKPVAHPLSLTVIVKFANKITPVARSQWIDAVDKSGRSKVAIPQIFYMFVRRLEIVMHRTTKVRDLRLQSVDDKVLSHIPGLHFLWSRIKNHPQDDYRIYGSSSNGYFLD